MDKRSNNGGHSTKAKRLDDKRLNSNKGLIAQYVREDFSYDKLKALMNKLYDYAIKGDTKAATLFLAYIEGKPIETKNIDVTTDGEPVQQITGIEIL